MLLILSVSLCDLFNMDVFIQIATARVIVPGGFPTTPHWNDTDGNRIEAHAAGLLFDAGHQRWFW